MADRVPIGTHPGSVSGLLNQDLPVAPAATAPYTVTRVWLRRTDDTTDALVAAIRNATGGGGDGLAVTIADGAEAGLSTGAAITVDVGEALYLRVTSANLLSMNLSGWFEIEGAPGVTSQMTTLARVKAARGITDTSKDSILNTLIAGVTAAMQSYMGRSIVQVSITDERMDGDGVHADLVLAEYPVIEPPAVVVRLNGDVVATADYEVDAARGLLVRVTSGAASGWTSGRRSYGADYTAGYATVPEDLAAVATAQVESEYLRKQPGENRLGLRGAVLEPGGDATYLTGAWVPGAERIMDRYRNLRAA